jgi:hypothetical protein
VYRPQSRILRKALGQSKQRRARRLLCWRDSVELVALNSNQEVTFANTGDGDIFLSNLSLRLQGGSNVGSVIGIGIRVRLPTAVRFASMASPSTTANVFIGQRFMF